MGLRFFRWYRKIAILRHLVAESCVIGLCTSCPRARSLGVIRLIHREGLYTLPSFLFHRFTGRRNAMRDADKFSLILFG